MPKLSSWLRSSTEADWPGRFRWVAAGAVASVCLLVRTADPRLLPDGVLAAVAGPFLLYSVALPLRRLPAAAGTGATGGRSLSSTTLALDLAALALLILFSGGAGSPLTPFLLLPVVVGPFLGKPSSAHALASLASILLAAATLVVRCHPLPGLPVADPVGPTGREGWEILVGLASWTAVFFVAATVASSISSRLAIRERELRELCSRLELQAGELRATNLRLEKLVRAKTSPMLRVAHQLRAPLSSIQGLLEVILKGYVGGPDSAAQEMVGLARDNAASMLELINDLLFLGHVREVGFTCGGEPVELDRIAREVVRANESVARLKRVDLAARVAEGGVRIRGNGEFTKQLVLNLVENALKYTPTGGGVVVSVYRQADRAVVSVSDTGIGIPAEDLPRVFDEFFRAENARKAQRVGTGLGLAIARQIAELQGGEISVTSELGKGSTFSVCFPSESPEQVDEGEGPPASVDAGFCQREPTPAGKPDEREAAPVVSVM